MMWMCIKRVAIYITCYRTDKTFLIERFHPEAVFLTQHVRLPYVFSGMLKIQILFFTDVMFLSFAMAGFVRLYILAITIMEKCDD